MTKLAIVHVVGAGLAGLNCALRSAEAGARVRLYEATGHAGGRCRSYHDPELDRWIDNGNHLVFSGNRAALDFLRSIGASDSMIDPGRPMFPFSDVGSGERWTLRISDGRIPWWIFRPAQRIPHTKPIDYLALLRFGFARRSTAVARLVKPAHRLFRRLLEPLAVAVLNTSAEQGAARLLWPVIVETFGRGGKACHPLIAREGLSMSFIDPAVRRLEALGVDIRMFHRLREIERRGQAIVALHFIGHRVEIGESDTVVLAVPHRMAGYLLPDLPVPEDSRSIVNAHYRLPAPVALPDNCAFLALIGGTAHWLFFRGDVISATVSAAENLIDHPAEEIARRIWHDIRRAVPGAPVPLPPYRIVKEKTATFAQTPAQVRRRPSPVTTIGNLILAGDWTNTGLPATIEGALRSGQRAARLALARTGNSALPIRAAATSNHQTMPRTAH
ncbi:MAG: hydroxysqualene dehydroxylase HpnE [Dongiaceae bacterium]